MNSVLEYFYKSNPLFYFKPIISDNKFNIVKKDSGFKCNICTLDIETYIENNQHKLLCICFYDGKTVHNYYINDYKDSNSMLKSLFDLLLQSKYHDHSIYIHNGSSFDLVFLLKYLSNIKNIKLTPTYKDGKFLNIKINFK